MLLFLLLKTENALLICIVINALPRIFAESSDVTGIARKEKFSTHQKTELASSEALAFPQNLGCVKPEMSQILALTSV